MPRQGHFETSGEYPAFLMMSNTPSSVSANAGITLTRPSRPVSAPIDCAPFL